MKAQSSVLQTSIRFLERRSFAPFLLAIQPVLHLFLINTAELTFSDTLRAMLAALLFGSIVLGLVGLLLRDWLRAGAVASLFIWLFFLFGDISGWAMDKFGLVHSRTDLLILGLMAVILILWTWLVQRRIRNIASLNLYFNLLSLLLLVNSIIGVTKSLLATGLSLSQSRPTPVAAVETAGPRPDVYYIILDGYGRKDILQDLYGFDNSALLDGLAARGFYVAEVSSSNYVQTLLSLSSSLNMDYLQSLALNGADIEDRQALVGLVKRSRVRSILAQNGYQLVSFPNAYQATVPDAEVYYDPVNTGLFHPITAFESLVVDHTMARVLLYLPVFNRALIEMPYDTHRSQILFTFARLREIPALDGDYFVYAHIIAPHPPFVFDENGEPVPHSEPFTLADGNHFIKNHSRQTYVEGYRQQIRYVNTLVLEAVDAILAGSETPPIIIIQGDHGPGSRLHHGSLEKTLPAERFGILNAYYFPDQDYSALYPSISPVNSFRVVLNQFFQGNYDLIADRHYYSPWTYPFDFDEVKDMSLP